MLNDLPGEKFWQKLPLFLGLYSLLLASDQRFQEVQTTSFAVKFTFVGVSGEAVECDLLPVAATLWEQESKESLERAMRPLQLRYFSAVLGKFQVCCGGVDQLRAPVPPSPRNGLFCSSDSISLVENRWGWAK